MVPLYYKDERIKITIFIISALIIQFLLFIAIYFTSIGKLNQNIIAQNEAIIGTIASENLEIAEKIIPIITTNRILNIEEGRHILSQYSYSKDLNIFQNYLINNITIQMLVLAIISTVSVTILILIGIFALLDPLYKQIKKLTIRAENIVENKFSDIDFGIYKGSLDKFIFKFSLMEDRIINNTDLLHYEKIKLKNVINDISHQLITPLMALEMYIEILQDYKNMKADEVESFIQLISEQLQRMEWLVKTLLKYARLESKVVNYNKVNTSLNNTIIESMTPLKIKAKEKKQKLEFIETQDVIFYHDKNWITEALSNIIKNAIEHTPYGGKIEITLIETTLSITIKIKDTGEGIEKDKLKKIFERFYKGENSTNPSSIGIGLNLSKYIVNAHDGDITVESELGKGSTFYITFIKIDLSH